MILPPEQCERCIDLLSQESLEPNMTRRASVESIKNSMKIDVTRYNSGLAKSYDRLYNQQMLMILDTRIIANKTLNSTPKHY